MQVPRTFVFVDISGFTNYTTTHGDAAAGELLANWRRVTRDLASDTGVRIAKWLGDGCMIVAVDQHAAVAFALRLQTRSAEACAPLAVRSGIASGHALLFEGDDYIGSAVNMAARLCDAAGPFEILIPTMQIERLPQGVTARPHEPLELRGFPGEVDVVNLGGTLESDGADTGALWTRPRFM